MAVDQHGESPGDRTSLEQRVRDLSPWHIDIEVVPGLRTGDTQNRDRSKTGAVSLVRTEQSFKDMMRSIYPAGLEGRTFLDVACNCGAYTFWARDLGAGHALGFDARQHWIDQAQFLLDQRDADREALEFHVGDVMNINDYEWGQFDISYFGGILYHLPLPLTALKSVADVTSELLYLNTASRRGLGRPGLVMNHESTEPHMSGVHGLNWYPTGPEVVIAVLQHLGFVEFQIVFNRRTIQFNRQRGLRVYARTLLKGTGRFAILASKKHGLLTARSIEGGGGVRSAL